MPTREVRGKAAMERELDRTLSEAAFQREIVLYAEARGWRTVHFRPAVNRRGRWSTAIQGDPGFPDVVLVRASWPGQSGGRLLFLEVKKAGAKPSEEQRCWLADLQAVGGNVEALLVQPADRLRLYDLLD